MLNVQLFIIPNWVHVVWISSVTLIAFWRGRWRERVIASSHLIQTLIAMTFCSLVACSNEIRIWRELASDATILAICLACAWRTERYPILWASSFALLSVATDLMGGLIPGVTEWAYNSANIVWAYLLDACVGWSALSDPRRKACKMADAEPG